MKSKLLAIFLLAGSSMFAGPRFSVGIGVGVGGYYRPYAGYYAAPVVPPAAVYAPAPVYPAYGSAYVAPGYVAPAPYLRAPYAGAVWVGPHWFGGRYYRGYWRHR